MPTPFPGMDPYLEDPYLWEAVHLTFMGAMAEILLPQVLPKYWVAIERRIYMDVEEREEGRGARPDVVVSREPGAAGMVRPAPTALTIEPVLAEPAVAFEVRQTFLRIVRRARQEVVTIIELLSHANKRPGSEGRGSYLAKRQEILRSGAHLVEIDLLREGTRLPFKTPLPPADYCAVVHRVATRPKAEVYCMRLRDSLPGIPVPLSDGDPDAMLDLRRAVEITYERRRYDHEIEYAGETVPPLEGADREWAAALLRRAGKR